MATAAALLTTPCRPSAPAPGSRHGWWRSCAWSERSRRRRSPRQTCRSLCVSILPIRTPTHRHHRRHRRQIQVDRVLRHAGHVVPPVCSTVRGRRRHASTDAGRRAALVPLFRGRAASADLRPRRPPHRRVLIVSPVNRLGPPPQDRPRLPPPSSSAVAMNAPTASPTSPQSNSNASHSPRTTSRDFR
jgi:hypothetical protein